MVKPRTITSTITSTSAPDAPLYRGFWGKLPAHGDFIGRGLPQAWIQAWDGWLERGLAWAAQAHGMARLRRDLADAPTWCCVIRPGCAAGARQTGGPGTWCAVLAPSRDRVGRPFPLTLAEIWPGSGPGSFEAAQARLELLLALLPLAEGADAAEHLAAALQDLAGLSSPPPIPAQAPAGTAPAPPWPDADRSGLSFWWPSTAAGQATAVQTQAWPADDAWLARLLAGR
jgi:type VI secretion system protein ImpM